MTASRSTSISRAGHSFSDQVERALHDQILRGQYRPGERLNEVEIANELSVSRGPVREAMQQLARDGLIELQAHRGAFVRELSPQAVQDLFGVRIALETSVARLAAEPATPEQHAQLRELLEPRSATTHADERFQGAWDLHGALAEVARNPALAAHVTSVNQELGLLRSQSGEVPERADNATAEHAAIIHAVLAGDGAAAEARLREALEHALAASRPVPERRRPGPSQRPSDANGPPDQGQERRQLPIVDSWCALELRSRPTMRPQRMQSPRSRTSPT